MCAFYEGPRIDGSVIPFHCQNGTGVAHPRSTFTSYIDIYNTYIDIYIYMQVPYLPSRGNPTYIPYQGFFSSPVINIYPLEVSRHLSQAAAATKSSCSCAIASLRYGFPSCTNLWRQIFFQKIPPVRGSLKIHGIRQ